MKDLWIVLAGNVPVSIKNGEITPITASSISTPRKSIAIPIFVDFHKAQIFAKRIKKYNFVFGESVRIIRGRFYNESD